MSSDFYDIRPMNDDDIAYISNSWLTSQWHEPQNERFMHKDVFMNQHHRIIEALYKADNVTRLVACDKVTPRYILGYLVGEVTEETPILHFAYTRQKMRGQYKGSGPACGAKLHIASTLWQTWLGDRQILEGGQYTHMSHDWRPYLRHMGWERRWSYNPYALYYRLPGGWQEGFLSKDAPGVWNSEDEK